MGERQNSPTKNTVTPAQAGAPLPCRRVAPATRRPKKKRDPRLRGDDKGGKKRWQLSERSVRLLTGGRLGEADIQPLIISGMRAKMQSRNSSDGCSAQRRDAISPSDQILVSRVGRTLRKSDCGEIMLRNPQAVAETQARIASTRAASIIASLTDNGTISRLGGLPNLPASIAWPVFDGRPMTFLAQIDLAELPNCNDLAWLPDSGTLFYFIGCGQGDEWVEEAGRVLFSSAISPEERALPRGSATLKVSHNLVFHVVDTFAPLNAEDDLGQWQDNAVVEAWHRSLHPRFRPWQIGGWHNPLQQHDLPARADRSYQNRFGLNAADRSAPIEVLKSSWRLLGQFDTDWLLTRNNGYSRGYFWVREDEAKRCEFDCTVLLGQAD